MSQLLKAHNQEKKGTKREAVGRKEGGGIKKGREKGGRGRETEMGRAVVQRRGRERERVL